MTRLLQCTRTRACSDSSSMMVMLISMTAQMHPCKNLWKMLQASCLSKIPLMSLLPLCMQLSSRKWMEVRLNNHLAKLKKIQLMFNLLLLRKRLLKLPSNRLKRTIRASRPNRILLQPNRNSLLRLLMRSKKKLSQMQKLQLPTNNEKYYLRTYGIEI